MATLSGSKLVDECLMVMVKRYDVMNFAAGAKRARSIAFPLWVYVQTTFCFYSGRGEVRPKGFGWVI